MNFGLSEKTINKINSVFEKHLEIDEVIIYGSRAKGNFREGSDIDITLKGDITKEDLNKLWHRLDDSFIPYKFDISIYNNLKSESLIEHIQRVGKIFYKRIN